MNSTKAQKVHGQCKNPFSNSLFRYGEMSSLLDHNENILRLKFPFEDREKIKSLLEEFDNNIEMVSELLKQERNQVEIFQSKGNITKMSDRAENKLLKNAILGLNRKLVEAKRQLSLITQQNNKLARENEGLRLHNRFLLDKESPNYQINFQGDIY